MKKILFVVENLSGGGAEKVLLTLVKNLSKEKYSITIYTIVNTGVYVEEIKKYCTVKYALKDYKEYSMIGKLYYKIKYQMIYKLNTFFVYKWLIKEKYDIEIAFVEGFSTKFVAASNNKSSKKYSWIHIDMIERPYADKYYKSFKEHVRYYSKFDKVICVSKQAQEKYEEKFGIKNSIVIYNPIDKESLVGYRKEYQIGNTIKFCAVGRLEMQKGFDRLIKALSNLKDYKYELFIIGNGSQMNSLKSLANRLRVDNQIHFIGFLNDPYQIMAGADVIICSSRSEGFSLVIAEGLCLGIPILTTDCTGPLELIDYGKYGILVDNSTKGIYQGLLKIFNNKNLLYKMHKLSVERSTLFEIEKVIKKVEALLDE